MTTTVFLVGPIEAEDFNAPLFKRVQDHLINEGYEVDNPHDLQRDNEDENEAMRHDVAEMITSDEVAVLPDWDKSHNACSKIIMAILMGLKINTVYIGHDGEIRMVDGFDWSFQPNFIYTGVIKL